MNHPRSETAVQVLKELDVQSETDVNLSFSEKASLITAEWATRKFGAQLMVNKVLDEYNQAPQLDSAGRPIPPEDLGHTSGEQLSFKQEIFLGSAMDVADDLRGAYRRVDRGYSLGQVSVHGVFDTAVIISSLEKAVEINPDNLYDGEQHHQAAARYILDHMQTVDADIGNSRSYLL